MCAAAGSEVRGHRHRKLGAKGHLLMIESLLRSPTCPLRAIHPPCSPIVWPFLISVVGLVVPPPKIRMWQP